MKKILIAYTSRTGITQQMADYLAEGARMGGNDVTLKKLSELKDVSKIEGFDAYLFGCATYHKDMTGGMKQFLFMAERANLMGKIGGAFGSHTHSGESAPMIYDTMQHVFKMDMVDLGPLKLNEAMVKTNDGMVACHQYARAVNEKL